MENYKVQFPPSPLKEVEMIEETLKEVREKNRS
jgi:hypothetical protein